MAEEPNGSTCSTLGEVDWGYDILEDALERLQECANGVAVAATGSKDDFVDEGGRKIQSEGVV